MNYIKCSNKGCRRARTKSTLPLPYEYLGGKKLIIFGWVFHLMTYKNQAEPAYTTCDDCAMAEQEAHERRQAGELFI